MLSSMCVRAGMNECACLRVCMRACMCACECVYARVHVFSVCTISSVKDVIFVVSISVEGLMEDWFVIYI